MIASQIRQEARNILSNKWGKAALLTLVFSVIDFAICFMAGLLSIIPGIGFLITIGLYVIQLPMAYGFLVSLIKLKRNEEVDYVDFFALGFSSFGRLWGTIGNILLKMLVLVILAIVFFFLMLVGMSGIAGAAILGSGVGAAGFSVLGIIGVIGYIVTIILIVPKSYSYSLSFFLLYDNPDKSTKELVEQSEQLMEGHRWSYFWLYLTFIGWSILASFTFGIGLLWLVPYIVISAIIFYENRIHVGITNSKTASSISENLVTESRSTSEEDNPIQENE